MKTAKKLTLILALSLVAVMCLVFNAGAEELVFGDYTYTVLEDDTVKITGYNGNNKNIVIPSVIDGKAVTVIGELAFVENKEISSVVIPDSVTAVEKRAFAWCENLLDVTFGNSLTTIGHTAFGYTALFSIELPDTVTEIGDFAFAYIRSLGYADLGENVKHIGAHAFNLCDTLDGGLHLYNVEYIGTEAFANCVGLKAVSVSEKLAYVGRDAFPDERGFCLYYAGSEEQFNQIEFEEGNGNGICREYNHVHEFGEYYSDNNATTYCDGSKSAVCLNGCEFRDKIRDKGTKLEHVVQLTKVTATQTTTEITLKWNAAIGANTYKIYYKNGGNWKLCATTSATSHTFKNLKPGAKYTFSVQAGRILGTSQEWPSGSAICETATKSAPISNATDTQTTSSIKLTWSASEGATGYRIFYQSGGKWKTTVSSTSATSHTFKNLKSGMKYTFAIRPYVKNGSAVIWSDYIELSTATKTDAISKITATQTESTIKLTWNAVKGATGYRIYYKSGSSWKVSVSATTKTTHTFKNLKAGAKFTFAVRPYVKTADTVIWSAYTTYTAATLPAAPKTTATSSLGGQAVVSWSAVNGAEGYKFYYKVNNGSYKLYKTYAKPQKLTFNNLTKGAKYTFAVRAYKNTTGGAVTGTFKPVSVTIAYKITRYEKVFESGKFYMQVKDPDLGVVAMALNGNKMYVESSMDGMSMKLIFRGDKKNKNNPDGTWYMVFDDLKKYATASTDLLGNTEDVIGDFEEKGEKISYKTTYETIGGKRYEVESGKDSQGVTYKYYFNGDTLVRSQEILADGTVSTTDFVKISSSVPDSLFTIPSDYAYINLEWLLNSLV